MHSQKEYIHCPCQKERGRGRERRRGKEEGKEEGNPQITPLSPSGCSHISATTKSTIQSIFFMI
jgi:hypothetical protein